MQEMSGHFSANIVTFKCGCCHIRKPVTGRKRFKRVGEGKDGRPVYNYKCLDCQRKDNG